MGEWVRSYPSSRPSGFFLLGRGGILREISRKELFSRERGGGLWGGIEGGSLREGVLRHITEISSFKEGKERS